MSEVSRISRTTKPKTGKKVKGQTRIGIFKGSTKGDPKGGRGKPKVKPGKYLVMM